MNKFSNQLYKAAFLRWWETSYRCKEVDRQIQVFLTSEIKGFVPGESWLQKAREASLISTTQAAEKMGISRSGFSATESREKEGKVSLEVLAKAAEAIDCEFVYAIRPKKKERFSVSIWKKLVQEAEKHSWVQTRPSGAKARALAKIARDLYDDPKFRQKQGWSERREPVSN